jgi:DNA mismatch endonuclease (patch repair protein)
VNRLRSSETSISNMSTDIVSPEVRSLIMKSVGQTNTRPEKAVRQILKDVGIRYRLHNRDLPGTPDFANRRHRWAIFVNGCFWHGHKNCQKTKGGKAPRVPLNNRQYWAEKLNQNRSRDARKCRELRELGFRVHLVWECELKDLSQVRERLVRFLARQDEKEKFG